MSDLTILHVLREKSMRRQRVLRDNTNPLDWYSDQEFYQRFRFNKKGLLALTQLLEDDLRIKRNRPDCIPPLWSILIALRFFATGSHEIVIGDTMGDTIERKTSQPTVSRIISKVADALCRRSCQFIRFPTTPDEIRFVQEGFFKLRGFPGVVGCVDGTHVKIQVPIGDVGVQYIGRKGPTINCMFICDHRYRITNAVVNRPGRVHDSRIFRESAIGKEFINGKRKGYLLGDSGYANRSYLLTPYPEGNLLPHQRAYNKAHSSTRMKIECTFGIAKRRFGCLKGLRVEPDRACRIIVACAVLHNIFYEMQQPKDPEIDAEMISDADADDTDDSNSEESEVDALTGDGTRTTSDRKQLQIGKMIREDIAKQYFNDE